MKLNKRQVRGAWAFCLATNLGIAASFYLDGYGAAVAYLLILMPLSYFGMHCFVGDERDADDAPPPVRNLFGKKTR